LIGGISIIEGECGMKNKLRKAAEARLAYLREWLSRIKEAQDRVSDVQDMVERTEWEFKVFTELPDDAQEFIYPGLIDNYELGNKHLYGTLPLPPRYTATVMSGTASVTVSGSSDVYSFVSQARQIDIPDINLWSGKHIRLYKEIQETQTRFDKIKRQLGSLSVNRVKELDVAQKSYAAAISDLGERVTAGITMRNLLEHFKGDLFEKARNRPRENMTWQRMTERMSIGQVGEIEYQELINQERKWNSLQQRLSEVAKGQRHGLVADLEDIWTKLTDHLFTVLGIIKLG
jgi:hypothetical protein